MSKISPQPLELSVVLSLRNEEMVLPELIKRLEDVLVPLVSYELIFVNDASTDKTELLLDQYAGEKPSIKILHLSRRFGVQASIMEGLRHASGNAVIMMDADLQDPPEIIPQMLEERRRGAEVVYTVRSSREGEGRFKKKLTQLAYKVLNRVSEIPLPIEAGDFKLLSRRAVNELLRHPEQMPYLRGLISALGFLQVPIYYARQPRYAGKSHFPVLSRGPVQTFFSALVSFSPVPLYAILGAGVLAIFISLFIFLALLLAGINSFERFCLALIVFLLSGILLSLGWIGIYLWYVLKQVQGRPQAIVARKVNFLPSTSPVGNPI